jgi:hypothetical protein
MSLKDKVIKLMYRMDKEYNGDHMSHEVAEVAVHCLGERFSKEFVRMHLPMLNEHDAYYVINMLYSDYKPLLKEDDKLYVEMTKLFIEDEDAPSDKTKRYFYAMLE